MREALADPLIFGSVLSGESWSAWRALLIAAAGEPLAKNERKAFKRLTGRSREPQERVEELFVVAGRRSGKTRIAAVLAVYYAALVDYSKVLAVGERAVLPFLSATTRQARKAFGYAAGFMEASPLLSGLVINKTIDTLRLSTGVDLEIQPASWRGNRGDTCAGVVGDEACFWRDETSANADVEILNALRPSLATTSGPLIVISSPHARKGEVYATWRRHYGAAGDPQILVAQAASRELNPALPKRVVDRAMERDPAAARAEYLSEWRDDLSSFVNRDLIETAVDRGVLVRPPRDGLAYTAFTDPSGGGADSFTTCIAHREKDVAVIDCLVELPGGTNVESATAQIAATLKSYRVRRTTADKFGAGWPVAAFARHGISLEHSDRNRSEIYIECLPLFSSGCVRLIDNPRLVSQFAGLERRTFATGKDVVDHGRGGHDDLCNSAAGALVQAMKPVGSLRIPPGLIQKVEMMGRARKLGLSYRAGLGITY